MGSSKKSDRLADLTATLAARKAVPAVTDEVGGADGSSESVAAVETPPRSKAGSLVPNQSVSLYECDLDALEAIRTWLSKRGVRGCNSSEAIRLCIRLAAKEANADMLATICREARDKDGRKTRWAKTAQHL